jgi:hypothetical protein
MNIHWKNVVAFVMLVAAVILLFDHWHSINSALSSIKSVAAILAGSDRAVWRLISNGEQEAVHVGRCAQVLQSSVKQFIGKCKNNGGLKKLRSGKRWESRIYRGRYRLQGERRITDISMNTSDKQSAKRKLDRIVQEQQQEAAGILAPKALRDAVSCPLREHVAEFCADLRARRCDEMYVYNVEKTLNRRFVECGWQYLKDITSGSFLTWRSRQRPAAKTLNECLSLGPAFLNWMGKFGLALANPLKPVDKVETRGHESRKRRALTDNEAGRLLQVAGPRMVVYLAALLTGLRRGELQALQWGDVISTCHSLF